MKAIKVEWCENWIRSRFTKHLAFPGGGIEVGCFWAMAEESGLWLRGTFGSAMSIALEKLTNVETIHNNEGQFLYNVFRLKEQ